MTKIQNQRPTRGELVEALIERDGLLCKHPACGRALVRDATGQQEITIDHWIPQSWAFANNWTYDQVWDLTNLKLMHKKCNASKGDTLPNEDGTLPSKTQRTFRFRRDKRAQRAEVCTSCAAGRDLGPNEICAACGSGPMPERFPRWAKMSSAECDHELFWCWACSIGIIERSGATEMILINGEGGE